MTYMVRILGRYGRTSVSALLLFVSLDGVHVCGLVFTAVFTRISVKLEILAKFYNFVGNTLV